LRLKKRDFEFWVWKAQKALVEKEMRLANTIRIAMTKQEQYDRFFNDRRTELARLDGKRSPVYEESWAFLKMKGRG